MQDFRLYLERVWPVLLAVAVPASAFGPAPLGISTALAFLVLLIQPVFRQTAKNCFVEIRHDILGKAGLILLVAWAISAAGSLDIEKSSATLARMFIIIVFMVIVSGVLAQKPHCMDLFKKAALILSVVVLLYIALILIGWSVLFVPVQALKGDHLVGHHFFKSHASTAVVFLPFLIWCGWTLGGQWRHLSFSGAVLTIILLYGAGKAISFAGLAGVIGAVGAAGFILVVSSVKRGIGYLFWVAATALFVGISYFVATSLPEPPYQNQMPDLVPFIDSHRELIWSFVLEAQKSEPFFGYGPNAVNHLAGAGAVIEALNQEYIPSHPHNWMIEILAETGWIGFLMLLVCLALHLRQIVRGVYIDKPAALALAASSGAFWVSGLVNFSFWASWWQIAYLLALIGPFAALKRP